MFYINVVMAFRFQRGIRYTLVFERGHRTAFAAQLSLLFWRKFRAVLVPMKLALLKWPLTQDLATTFSMNASFRLRIPGLA